MESKLPHNNCLHWNKSLNKAVAPPPLLLEQETFINLKFGGADSVRNVATM